MVRSAIALVAVLETLGDAPSPAPGSKESFPACVVKNMALRSGKPVIADVRSFIKHPDGHRQRSVTFSSDGNVGMLLRDTPHDLGEFVEDVVNNSQAYNSGVRKGWIITDVDGKKFSSKERLKDVADDFAKAKKAGVVLTVKYDVRAFLECTNGDCTRSSKFPADDVESCADACVQVAGCDWWSWGKDDEDNMCWLQRQEGSSLMSWQGLQTAPKTCAPKPSADAAHTSAPWPSCQVLDSQIFTEGGPVYVDVKKFIHHDDENRHRTITFKSFPAIGMVFRNQPSPEGEVVDDVQMGSSAWDAGVRRGWIVKEVDGKIFKRAENLPDVGKDFQQAKDKAPTLLVKFDVRTSLDCHNGDCTSSDTFPVASEADCAMACRETPECKWWSFSTEVGEDMMCWFRSSSQGIMPQKGAISGTQACSPAKGSFTYKIVLFLVALGILFYRHQILEQLQQVPMFRMVLSKFTSGNPYQKLKTNDFDMDASAEEQAGLVKKFGRDDDMDFDEL